MDKKHTAVRVVILFLCTFPSDVLGTDSCDDPNGGWKQQGQHYYWVTGTKFNYDNARAECEKVPGGQLAEILDKATLLLLHNELHAVGGGNYVFHYGLEHNTFLLELITCEMQLPGCFLFAKLRSNMISQGWVPERE